MSSARVYKRAGRPLAQIPRLLACVLLTNRKIKPLAVVHALAVIKPESQLIKITEQVEGFDANVGSIQAALQQAPEVLKTVGVDFAANIFNSVVDDFMLELIQAFI